MDEQYGVASETKIKLKGEWLQAQLQSTKTSPSEAYNTHTSPGRTPEKKMLNEAR